MDIRKRLEEEHSKRLTTAIVNYVGDDKKRFRELMTVFLGKDAEVARRAAWPLSYIAADYPAFIQPHIGKLVQKLQEPGNHPGITRNILRMFQDFDVPEKYEAILLDVCFKLMVSETQPAAIRAFAITSATNICKAYPELKNELLLILRDLHSFPQLPAVKHRIKTALKALGTA